LAEHLKNYNKEILDNGFIHPGDKIGEVGTSGLGISESDCDGKYKPHLHVTYFSNVIKDNLYVQRNSTTNSIDATGYYDDNYRSKKRNPFLHNSEPQQKHKKKKVSQ